VVLVDIGEPSPWACARDLRNCLRQWADEGFDEVVAFRPDCYSATCSAAGVDYRDAAGPAAAT
jgi:hypothetical protein